MVGLSEGIHGVRGGRARGYVVILSLIAAFVVVPVSVGPVAAADDSDHPITASNAVVIDGDTGRVLYEQAMHEQVAPASLTKIFTAIVALESSTIDRELEVVEYDQVGEASIGLVPGERFTLETLLYGLMLTSGNDAAMTISRELAYLPGDSPQESVSRFLDRVDGTVNRLGLQNTTLRNPHGLDQNGHVSSAADIAAMTMYALGNPIFIELISTPYHAADGREFYNVNALLESYPGLVGGKTGVTSRAGHSLVQVAQRDGKTVIAVILGSTRERWYADAEYLLDLGFERLREDPDGDDRPVVGLAANTTFDVPDVATDLAVGGNFTVDRVNDNEAVVRSSSPVTEDEAISWVWPIVSLATMGVALVVVLNFSTIAGLGALAVERGSRIRFSTPSMFGLSPLSSAVSSLARSALPGRRRRTSRDQARGSAQPREHTLRVREPQSTATVFQDALLTPAMTRAEKAIQLAMQSRYHAATESFRRALELDPDLDPTRCPGFWRMQPMGYISAAKAYALAGRTRDARRLLTVVQLAFKSNHELVGLFGRAIKALDE